MRLRHALLLAAGAPAALSAFAPGSAASAPRPEPSQFRDRVFEGTIARPSSLRGASPATGYPTPDGLRIEVRVSSTAAAAAGSADAVAQTIVSFLASRLHGAELGRLKVFIGTPNEIRGACGGDARVLACYSSAERRMYIPDRDPEAGGRAGFTRDYAITHEYGHHIAAFRSNSPFPALNFGAKYWASYEFVCAGADDGIFFPGNQGEHYLDDPGEAFADTYAHLHYPDVPWQYNERLRPDAGSYAALRRDVLDPWRGSKRKVLTGYLGGGRNAKATSFTGSLDGRVNLRLSGPRGANFDIALYAGSRRISRTRARGSRDGLRLVLCRHGSQTATARVRVLRRGGAGRFKLTILYPG